MSTPIAARAGSGARSLRQLRVLVLAGFGCGPSSSTSAPASTPRTPNATAEPSPPNGAWHVGVLGQRGEPECSGAEQRWIDVEPRIGNTPIAPLSAAEEAWLDRPVVAHGHPGAAPASSATATVVAPCPTPQARSDWEFTPRGLRIVRDGGSNHAYFVRDELRALGELTVSQGERDVIVDFRNPVPVELADVVIRVHYEGCRGKPGTQAREQPVGVLAIAAGVQATFPRLVGEDDVRGRGAHRAHSVQIVAHGADVTFDLDVPLAVLGAAVPCPER